MLPRLGRMPAGWCGRPATNTGKVPSPVLRGGRNTGLIRLRPAVALPVRSPRKHHSDVPGETINLLKISTITANLFRMCTCKLIACHSFPAQQPKPFFRVVNRRQSAARASSAMLAKEHCFAAMD